MTLVIPPSLALIREGPFIMEADTSNLITFFIQYPICDIRSLLVVEKSELKPFPSWDNPIPNKQFLQYFGHLKRRRKGGHDYFHDELFFIDGKGGFKFPKLENVRHNETSRFNCIFRRLLNDGKSSIRYEIALQSDYIPIAPPSNSEVEGIFNDLIRHVCNIPVQIKNLTEKPKSSTILQCGKHLSALYEKASSSGEESESSKINLVRDGELCILLEYNADFFNFSKDSKPLGEGLNLFFRRLNINDRDIGVFLLGKEEGYNPTALRKLRIGIMRMYAEHQNLINVFNYIRIPSLNFDADFLGIYLNKKTKYFLKRNDPIKDLLFSYYSLIPPSDISLLENNLDKLRLQIKKKVWDLVGDSGLKYSLNSGDIEQVVGELIIDAKTKKAIKVIREAIKKIGNKDFQKTVIILSANLKVIENHIIHGDLGNNEIAILTNKLNLNLLDLASNINEAIKSDI
jgi:hypothetical protein